MPYRRAPKREEEVVEVLTRGGGGTQTVDATMLLRVGARVPETSDPFPLPVYGNGKATSASSTAPPPPDLMNHVC